MEKFCNEHPKYTAYRRPDNKCASCWGLYFLTKNKTLDEYARSIASTNSNLSEWLKENKGVINNAPIYKRTHMESDINFSDVDNLILDGFEEVFSGLPEDEEEEGEEEEVVEPPKGQKGRFV